jgi:quercetin dioxygenase-like cupin family protein
LTRTFDLNQLASFSPKQGLLSNMAERKKIKHDVLKTGNFNVVLICLETGQEIPSRPEPYGVCFYVIDGEGAFTIGAEQFELAKGGLIFAQANESRGILCTERLTLLGIQDPH